MLILIEDKFYFGSGFKFYFGSGFKKLSDYDFIYFIAVKSVARRCIF